MQTGPDQIVRCPACGALGSYHTLLSGNTFGARYFTDGECVAPMWEAPPLVVRCGRCRNAFWLEDAEEVGTVDPIGRSNPPVDPAWNAALGLVELDEAGYLDWLDRLIAAKPDAERVLRLRVWRLGNDPYRQASGEAHTPQPAPSAAREANMRAVLPLLDDADPTATLVRADVLRQLGEFDGALAVLETPLPEAYAPVVQQFRALCEARERGVRELKEVG